MEGITRVDDKTVRFTTKAPMSLITFNSSYARYLIPFQSMLDWGYRREGADVRPMV